MVKVYHNPRCKKSRAGLEYVKQRTTDFEVIEYIKNPITFEELQDVLIRLDSSPIDMVRRQESLYKSNFKGKNFTNDEWIKIMVENPKLIKRPIVVKGPKAVWGDPAENIDLLFNRYL